MNVTDLDGKTITVTNLKAAIKETGQYMGYSHINPEFRGFDRKQNAYWLDLHKKLLQLQSELKTDKSI
jgi:hypothetical protein